MTWENLTSDERFASIRRDFGRFLDAYQQLNGRLAALSEHLIHVEAIAIRAAGVAEERQAQPSE
jgi:hypothetical protein